MVLRSMSGSSERWDDDRAEGGSPRGEMAPVTDGQKTRVRVLVLIEQRMVREGFSILLEGDRELELVGAVAEPSEIVMVCRSTPPDVVVLDLEHPGVRQAEIGPRLRDACPGARLIGVAETDNPDLAQRAVDFGLSAVYLKTAPSEELIDLVKRAGEGEIVLESSVPAVPTQGNGAGPVPHGPSPRLTPREGQILRLLAEGRGTAQLARELAISPLTVQSHVKSILEKLGVHSKIEAVTLAFRTGMVGLPGVRATTGQAK